MTLTSPSVRKFFSFLISNYYHSRWFVSNVAFKITISILALIIVLFLIATPTKNLTYETEIKSFAPKLKSRDEIIGGNIEETSPVSNEDYNKTSQEMKDPQVMAYSSQTLENVFDVHEEIKNVNECFIPEWNNITTETIPFSEMNEVFMKHNVGNQRDYLFAKSPSLLAAFAYKDHIAVTMTAETYYGKPVFCRYFDCNLKEIPSSFNSSVFPDMTVLCGRRAGAEYISISETLEETPEYPVRIIRRTEPEHYFTVCMATLYGDEPKFIQIADFVEYYKLQGATFFHIYIRNVSNYDRLLLDDYIRTGDVEVIKMHDHFWRDDFMWHHPQINDCLYRNKYFSKWTAVIDLDERIEMKNEIKTIGEFLDTVTNPHIASLVFRIQWVLKDENSPERYINDTQISEEMLFRKFHKTSRIGAYNVQPKCIIRPEKIAVMNIHSPHGLYHGIRLTFVPETTALVRHYRNNHAGDLGQGNVNRMEKQGPFTKTSIDAWIEESLTQKMLTRIKNVYIEKDEFCKQERVNQNVADFACWKS